MSARPTAVIAAAVTLFAAPLLAVASETTVTISVETKSAPDEANPADREGPFQGKRPAVDIALLLDTSNSMDGLINQAKEQLWKIVNRFSEAKKQGKTPVLRVGLFEYGNTRLPASEGYIRQVAPLTDDLDKLSEALFALKTSGGDEYCGQVISEAVKRLDWAKEPGGYKAIFIAGNEPFTQGPVDYQQACKHAIEQGVVVNTIHCGGYGNGVSGQWAHGAQLAEGRYLNIDQDRAAPRVPTPHDRVIIELSSQLNGTYLWYGREAARYRANQAAQDENASRLSPNAAAERGFTKSSYNYDNRGRCVVDDFLADETALEKLSEENLPEVLKKMAPEERVAHVRALAAKRRELQAQIKELNAKRDAFVAESRKERGEEDQEATLADAVTDAIGEQLEAAGFDE